MRAFLALPADEREQMGHRGREKMVREFDERIVLDMYLAAIREIVD
ncbi:hypothetical protein [Desulfohalobium retbaense]|nr:hypothetical protein [Desulfohalobium retbaense]